MTFLMYLSTFRQSFLMYLLQEFVLFINRSHNLSFFIFYGSVSQKTYTAQLYIYVHKWCALGFSEIHLLFKQLH